MNLLITGNGTAGSWKCRGEQIGAALGAKVNPQATLKDFKAADLTMVVKRVPDVRLAALRESGKPWVLDIVDFYPQPHCGDWDRDEAIEWARHRLEYLKPNAVIWPNKKMQEDVGFSGPQTVIYHHHRPGIASNPIRKDVRTIGYEGSPAYIEPWRGHIESECDKRGWRFVVNPAQMADLDIVLALRGGKWNGYVQANWKSQIKMANAHASGTPFIGSPEAGYLEVATGCEYWATNARSLRMSFDWLTDHRTREQVSDRFRARAFTVDQAARQFESFLETVK
jgi:hypothetical protein